MTYLIEFTWGLDNSIKEEKQITTDDLDFTLDQLGRHRNNIQFIKIKQVK